MSKIPPQNIEAEKAVLGSLMIEKNTYLKINDILHDDIFYNDYHNIIYKAIKTVNNNDKSIDILTITEQLRKTNELEKIGGAYALTQLTDSITSTAYIEQNALMIKEASIRRSIIKKSGELFSKGFELGIDLTEIITDLQDFNESIVNSINNKNSTFKLSEYVHKSREQYLYRNKLYKEGKFPGIPSRLLDYNKYCGGHLPGDLIIIAGRPAMGKTAFALSEARNAAENGFKPIFFSLEMTGIKLTDRLIIAKSGINSELFRLGRLSESDITKFEIAAGHLSNLDFNIDDKPYCTMDYIKTVSKQYKLKGQCDIIFIDYLQLADMQGEKKYNREQEVSQMSRKMKALAKDLDVPVILLSQLSRNVETRGGSKVPTLSDLRESGAIEQDADVVLFPYRPSYYKIKGEDGESLENQGILIVAKHRHAGMNEIKFRHNNTITEFYDFESSIPF